ncbi:MAG TPA: D-sedoheptulose 7-phosphate isomerase [Deltaproteobacteria bacterium]|nr:D-sedoheptulose 7-phosphate isomerase [Deltaproteobacteria bacterium]HPX49494.1 D-sedoheptulose 7-phosphate isomerase [Deltaproteobacteria bacterium]HQA70709.1 D-sedoheptulose 7-phosphate isomerase [Deltaproteobacteria bacterium]HRR69766.1 D-sedoheptulose 7-phosphate isomerase [Desulfomonilia bacterium]HRT45717.1 D-sedoheptulose 7-phosphate isomerase [Desulfomonilia bacterium]
MDRIQKIIDESVMLHSRLSGIVPVISEAAGMMVGALAGGNKIMFAGNGGSAADAQHLAAELVNRFQKNRQPLAGLALTTDTSIMTAVGNDFSFEEIFSKQVRALGRKGDVLVGISTSGSSKNIIRALDEARSMGISTVALTGEAGQIRDHADCTISVPSKSTPRVQEIHILIGHILCEIVEDASARIV